VRTKGAADSGIQRAVPVGPRRGFPRWDRAPDGRDLHPTPPSPYISAMISASELAMAYGDRTLFSGATFQLNPGERYGLVGANGSGKTTLLNVLSGDLDPTEGTLSVPRRVRLGVLRQDQFVHEGESVLGVTLMGNPELWEAMVEKEKLLERASESFDADRYSILEETIERHDGYTAEARASTILEGLGIPTELHHDPIDTLSGGFKLRVLLAQVLASAPDALLLDEPTNHLDILSIRWLETFLAEFSGPVVVISHDHRFLDNVATHILDVDYETVTLYHGNYSAFQLAKVEERERREKELEMRRKEIAHHRQFVDRFRAKASKARQAQSKMKLIEKAAESMEELPESSRRYPTFRFEPRRDSGKEVLKVKGIRKAFEDLQVLHGVDLQILRGERVAIIGPNGIGKSTLLKIVMGKLEPDEGEVEWGYETHPAYFAQDHREALGSADMTAEEWVWEKCPERDRGFVRGHMALMLFSGDEAAKRLGSLSGGEAARLVFSRLALDRPNVLVLDEPTNHLDMEAIEALVEGLKAFAGTLLLVSHDRWFVEQLATRVVEIRADGIRDYPGSYAEYVRASGDDHLDAEAVLLRSRTGGSKGAAPSQGSRNGADGSAEARGGNGRDTRRRGREAAAHRSRMERRSEELAAEVDQAEERIQEIDRTFTKPGFFERTPAEKVGDLQAERAELERRLESLLEEWEEVERGLDE
jgi:ATPase subunit of ABC transporter with duplicated ATPase domains